MRKRRECAPPGIRAAIFDMDGTLVNSEDVYWDADCAFLDRYGIPHDDALREYMIGRGTKGFIEWMRTQKEIPRSDEELAREKMEVFLAHARGRVQVFPEMRRLLGLLEEAGMPCALASGSPRGIIEVLLEETGLAGFFRVVVSADEVARPKPAPDVFLEAAGRLGVEPGGCVVFEDSEPGVRAGLDAGMVCVAIPTLVKDRYPEVFYQADVLFEGGMGEFSAERVWEWLGCGVGVGR
ncbi:HAD family hydrolase [Spirochaeta thermophila]|uniref:GS1-like protein n=1 Tax=Winmispira thermophila (strain ATCC 49972 / DSM 6192 / RI 19.B1) TaxID=665571 RepID=E0RT70_WINT6|nr:HAD family phosphatase [Spirochaeta thermophila]ADN02366.1 GS1-like protein [Spirochaeta thermophila DSM 6192]